MWQEKKWVAGLLHVFKIYVWPVGAHT
jgi:hypothetical protein